MRLDFKSCKALKIKNIFKKYKLVFIFNSVNKKNWLTIEQILKNLKLNYYKVQKSVFCNVFKNSTYDNCNLLLKGITVFIQSKTNILIENMVKIKKYLSLIGIKLNKKYYTNYHLVKLQNLDYEKTLFILMQLLKRNLQKFRLIF